MKHTVLPWTSRVQMQSGTQEVEWETTPTNPQWAKKAKEGRNAEEAKRVTAVTVIGRYWGWKEGGAHQATAQNWIAA